jgi:hypothetical protein
MQMHMLETNVRYSIGTYFSIRRITHQLSILCRAHQAVVAAVLDAALYVWIHHRASNSVLRKVRMQVLVHLSCNTRLCETFNQTFATITAAQVFFKLM